MQPAAAAHGDFMDPSPPITCSIGAGEEQLSWHTAGAPRAHSQYHRAIVYSQIMSPAGDVGSLARSLPEGPSAETQHRVCLRTGCLFWLCPPLSS